MYMAKSKAPDCTAHAQSDQNLHCTNRKIYIFILLSVSFCQDQEAGVIVLSGICTSVNVDTFNEIYIEG